MTTKLALVQKNENTAASISFMFGYVPAEILFNDQDAGEAVREDSDDMDDTFQVKGIDGGSLAIQFYTNLPYTPGFSLVLKTKHGLTNLVTGKPITSLDEVDPQNEDNPQIIYVSKFVPMSIPTREVVIKAEDEPIVLIDVFLKKNGFWQKPMPTPFKAEFIF